MLRPRPRATRTRLNTEQDVPRWVLQAAAYFRNQVRRSGSAALAAVIVQ